MKQQVSLFTSINPSVPNILDIAKTWTNNFDEVISINPKAEIERIRESFPGISFIERAAFRDKHIYINDIIHIQKSAKHETVAIINSDIWASEVEPLPHDKLIISHRIDIDSFDKKYNRKYLMWGFDFFSYPKKVVEVIPQSDMALGLPWWDYFVPFFILHRTDIKCKFLKKSKFHHLRHKQNWSWDDHYWLENEFQKVLGVKYTRESGDEYRFGRMIYSYILESTNE